MVGFILLFWLNNLTISFILVKNLMASSDFEKDIVRKFLSNEDSKIVWLSLINFGEPVSRDANWKINNINPVSYTHLTLPTIYSV